MTSDNRFLGVLIFAVIGSVVGSLLALELGFPLWWLAIPVGGLIGYIGCDPKQFVLDIRRAWEFSSPIGGFSHEFKWLCLWTASIIVPLATCVMILIIPFFPELPAEYAVPTLLEAAALFPLVVYPLIACLVTGIVGVLLFLNTVAFTRKGSFFSIDEGDRATHTFVVVWLNPVGVLVFPFVASVWLKRVVVKHRQEIRSWCWARAQGFGRFFVTAFHYINTHDRQLAGLCAMLGTVVGYMLGSAAIGGTTGLFFAFMCVKVVRPRLVRETIHPE